VGAPRALPNAPRWTTPGGGGVSGEASRHRSGDGTPPTSDDTRPRIVAPAEVASAITGAMRSAS
jgi:hypothetical protein